VSWSREDAAVDFVAYFANLADDDIINGQWDFEELDELRRQAKAIIEMSGR